MGVINTGVEVVDILLGVTVILRGVSGAAIVAATASADKLFSRKSVMCAVMFGRGSQFRYFPVGVVSEDVVVIRGGDKGKVTISDQPLRWSRDSSEDFVIVGSSEGRFLMGRWASDAVIMQPLSFAWTG